MVDIETNTAIQSSLLKLISPILNNELGLNKCLEIKYIDEQVKLDLENSQAAGIFQFSQIGFSAEPWSTSGLGAPLRVAIYYDSVLVGYLIGYITDSSIDILFWEISLQDTSEIMTAWPKILISVLDNIANSLNAHDYQIKTFALLSPPEDIDQHNIWISVGFSFTYNYQNKEIPAFILRKI